VALSVVLLVAAGLLLRTIANLQGRDPGFDPSRLITASVSLQDARYRTAAAMNRLFDVSLEELQRTPGVESASVSLGLPYNRLLNSVFRFSDRPAPATTPLANFTYVTPDFFTTLRIPVRAGRVFTADDRASGQKVVVVNDTFVRVWAEGANPIGRRLNLGEEWLIVGVVGDVQTRHPGFQMAGPPSGPLATPPIVYQPAAQIGDGFIQLAHRWFSPSWTIRMAGPESGEPALRRAIGLADPLLPLSPPVSIKVVQGSATAMERLMLTLVGGFAIGALLLAAVGIYGLVAQTVLDRRREFGIRMALGATPAQTMRRVTESGLALAATGTAIGIGLAWVSTRVIASFLWGVEAHDGLTFGATAGILFLVATIASVIPAVGILRIDPAKTLRG
jgi:predicted permease